MRNILVLSLMLWGSLVSFAQSNDFNYYKSLGLVQYYEKDFLQAIFNLQKASALKPADKEVASYLKMSYDSVGSKDLAVKARIKIEQFGTESKLRPTIQPAMASENPAPDKSKKSGILRPKSPYALMAGELRELGDYFMDRMSYDSAAICYGQYVKVFPVDTSVYFYLATSQYYIKKYDDAIRNFEVAIHKEPRRAELYNWIGVCELQSGNYLSARDYFKQCIRLDPDYSRAFFNLGKTQYELEDYGDAAKNLEKAQEMLPNDPDILRMLADIYYNTANWTKSKTLYEALYKLNPKNQRTNYRLGDIYEKLGQWSNAVIYLRNFMSLAPGNVDAEKKIGIAYYNLERYEYAIDNFEKSVKTIWDDKELLLYTAIASNKIGDYKKAIDYAHRALTLDKNYIPAYYQLSNAYKGLKDNKQAKENLDKAKDLEMNSVSK